MPNRLGLELRLLERMSDRYAKSILREVGLDEADAVQIRAQCQLKLPEQLDSDVAIYTSLLGAAVKSRSLGDDVPELFAGSTANDFLLTLWPHLYWTVNTRPDGQSWGVGFRNQVALNFKSIDPSIIRRGVWTRSALEHLADHHELHDGWDEQVQIRFAFDGATYEGSFVFGLLQDWRRI